MGKVVRIRGDDVVDADDAEYEDADGGEGEVEEIRVGWARDEVFIYSAVEALQAVLNEQEISMYSVYLIRIALDGEEVLVY